MLAKLQQHFIDAIYRDDNAFLQHIDGQIRPAIQQLDLYRNSVYGGLLKALTEIFPVCKKLLGEDFFDAMCLRYIKQTPSTHYDINAYGENFPDFVANFPALQELTYLPDTCRLEWFWHLAYQAEELDPMNISMLLTLEPGTLMNSRLVLDPTTNLLQSPYPVDAIWNMNQDDYQGDEKLLLDEQTRYYFLIWRQGLSIRIDKLDPTLFEFLQAIQAGKSIAELINSYPDTNSLLIYSLSLGYFHRYETC